jgi:hypothetical protein
VLSKDRVVFDAAAITESDKVGSFILGSTGALVESRAIGGSDWLQVAAALFDKDGDGIDSTTSALWVHLKASDVAINVELDHTDGDSVQIGDGTDIMAINGDGSINAIVTATNLDIRDLSAATDSVSAWTKDGTGTAIGSTASALNVYVTGSTALTVNDAALANTAVAATPVSTATTATNLVASALSARKYLLVQNLGNRSIYVGPSGVTTSSGLRVSSGSTLELRLGAAVSLYGICDSGTQDTRTLEVA